MMSLRPSIPSRSARIGPSSAGLTGGRASNPDGAGARINVPGESSGRQSAVVRSAGALGSWTKTQPPAVGETEPCGVRVYISLRDMAKRVSVVAAVAGVPAQEFDGEAGAVETIQLFHRLRRPPEGYGHGGLLDWTLVRRGEAPTIRKRRAETRPKACIARSHRLCDIFKVADIGSGCRQLLHSPLEEMPVAGLRHPASACQVAVVDDFGSIRFACRVQSEDY